MRAVFDLGLPLERAPRATQPWTSVAPRRLCSPSDSVARRRPRGFPPRTLTLAFASVQSRATQLRCPGSPATARGTQFLPVERPITNGDTNPVYCTHWWRA